MLSVARWSMPRYASPLGAGVGLVLISVVAMQVGQAVAKLAFPLTSPVMMTALRFGLGALVLCGLFRPRWPTDSRTRWAVIALGTVLAGTNLFVYESAARMPLGLAVAVQFTGALAVSLATSRRIHHVVWVLVATGGVLFLYSGPVNAISTAGVVYGVASAACWGAYILLTSYVGSRTRGGEGMALATTWAALLTVPLGVFADPHAFTSPAVLAAGLGVALLCTVIANSLELRSLRHMTSRVFGVLVSLEPAIAALSGLVLLGEHLTLPQWLAITAIVTASIGITADTQRTGTHQPTPTHTNSPNTDHHAETGKYS